MKKKNMLIFIGMILALVQCTPSNQANVDARAQLSPTDVSMIKAFWWGIREYAPVTGW